MRVRANGRSGLRCAPVESSDDEAQTRLVSPFAKNMTSSAEYRPDIDGLRAISILLVLGYHAHPWLLPGGFVGVDVFFVISGFLITQILLAQEEIGGFSIAAFYARRVRR